MTVGGDIAGGLVPVPGAAPAAPPAAGAPGPGRGGTPVVTMVKGDNGVWSGTTIRAVKPGAWRYTFSVDGTTTVDARNVLTSPNQTQVQKDLTKDLVKAQYGRTASSDVLTTFWKPNGTVDAANEARIRKWLTDNGFYDAGPGAISGCIDDKSKEDSKAKAVKDLGLR